MYPTTNLQPGMSGAEVKKLQNFLIGQGMSIPDGATGYFGNQTKTALTQWQQRTGVQAGTDFGYWGPKSIAVAKTVNSNVASINRSVATPPPVSTPVPQPSRTLTGIPGLAGGPPLTNNRVVDTSTPVTTPTYTPPPAQPYQSPPAPAAPVVDTSTKAVYDTLISKDPLLADFFKDPATKAEFDNLPPELQGTYLQMARSLQQTIENGKVLNPDLVEVTPAQLQEFYAQAEQEMDPYYKEQFGQLKGNLERSVSRLVEDYNKGVSRSEEPFKQKLSDQAQIESEQGTTYSSERTRREAASILGQNQALGDLAQGVQRSATDLGIGFEQKAGSDMARTLNMPSIQDFSASTQGYTPTSSRSLYVPLGGVTGSGQAERTTALKSRQNEFEADYRKRKSLDSSRSLII